jgi:hypothetical protein
MTLLSSEVVLAHAIVEHAAAIESLRELRDADIDDLEVVDVPSVLGRVMGWVGSLFCRVSCCCSVSAPEPEDALRAREGNK